MASPTVDVQRRLRQWDTAPVSLGPFGCRGTQRFGVHRAAKGRAGD
jgi:hypothetical protein